MLSEHDCAEYKINPKVPCFDNRYEISNTEGYFSRSFTRVRATSCYFLWQNLQQQQANVTLEFFTSQKGRFDGCWSFLLFFSTDVQSYSNYSMSIYCISNTPHVYCLLSIEVLYVIIRYCTVLCINISFHCSLLCFAGYKILETIFAKLRELRNNIIKNTQ